MMRFPIELSQSADVCNEFTAADQALFSTAVEWLNGAISALASPDWPRQLAVERGIDVATAALYEHLRREDRLISAGYADIPSLAVNSSGNPRGFKLAIVPGAFYREHPQTGADGAPLMVAARALGCDATVVPTPSIGTLAEGAGALLTWLQAQSGDQIVLASLSKGGADVKMALADPRASLAFSKVKAWINIGGITEGSPMVSWLLERKLLTSLYRFLFWKRGRNFQFIRDLDRRVGAPLAHRVVLPAHLQVIHVIGFSLRRHIQGKRAKSWHRRLSPLGPNDGAVILADSLAIPGKVIAAWGADHFSPQRLDLKLMLTAAFREIFGCREQTPDRNRTLHPATI